MTRIVLELPDDCDLDDVKDHKIAGLIRDALCDFSRARENGDAESYVLKRYAGNTYLCTAEKVAEVQGRLDLAIKLRGADVRIDQSDIVRVYDGDRCEHCNKPAELPAEDHADGRISKCCDDHASDIVYRGNTPEYTPYCPNCNCRFGYG